MFDLSFDKLLLVGLIAVFVLGPQRLPHYARKLAELVKRLRGLADTAQERVRSEMGPGYEDVDWKKLDPRQYDPRRIIREALLEEPIASAPVKPVTRPMLVSLEGPAPFDSEAT